MTAKAVVESLISRISNFHLSKEAQREENAKLIFNLCSELKGCGTKLIQLLALEEDLLPKSMLVEFNNSFNQVEPLSRIKTLKAVNQYLEKTHQEVFESFEYPPSHAGSIGQVHDAILKSGEKVAVKVQYPFVQSDMEFDFKLLRGVAKATSQKLIHRTVDEVINSIILELDYLKEAKSMQAFYDLREELGIHCPKPYKDYCGQKILVQEKIGGIALSSIEPDKVNHDDLQSIYDFFFKALIDHRLLYADPHPGNFLVGEEELGVVDFGLVKTNISDETIELLKVFFSKEVDLKETRNLYVKLGAQIEDKDIKDFEKGFLSYHQALHKILTGDKISFSGKFKEIRALRNVLMDLVNRKYYENLDTEFTMIHKSMHTLFFMLARYRAEITNFLK